jgi:hypothetical protein
MGSSRFVAGSGRLRAGDTVEIVTPGAGGFGLSVDRCVDTATGAAAGEC